MLSAVSIHQSFQIDLNPMLRATAGAIHPYIIRAIIGDAEQEPLPDHEVQGSVKAEQTGLYGIEDAVCLISFAAHHLALQREDVTDVA